MLSPVELFRPAECRPLVADQQKQSEENKEINVGTGTFTHIKQL